MDPLTYLALVFGIAIGCVGSIAKNDGVTIGKVHRSQVAKMLRSILGHIGINLDLIANVEHRSKHTCSAQVSGRTALEGIVGNATLVVFYVHVNVRVGVYPFDLSYGARYRKRLRRIEFRRN